RKGCSEHKKQSARGRNGKDNCRRTQHKCDAAENLAECRDKHKQRQRRYRHVDGECSQTEVSIAQRLGECAWDQVDNILEMPLLPTLALLLDANLRYWEMAVDPRLTHKKWRIACRGEGEPQGGIFRQPAVSKIAAQQQTKRESHPGAEEL